MDKGTLGPAERIIQTLLTYTDHMIHNRPGYVVPSPTSPIGLQWFQATHKVENGLKIAYRVEKIGKKSRLVRLGVLAADGSIVDNGRKIGDYRSAGLFPEVATWMYKQVAEVWKLDNEFAARWASYAFGQEHKDLKVILAAFMLVQSRKGDPVRENGQVLFYDEDYRDVGEAMLLLTRKDGHDFNPKLLLRVEDVLRIPAIVQINRELGFYRGAKNAFPRRLDKVVTKWLGYRERNPRMLEGLVKAGFRTSVMELAHRVHYKPSEAKFFDALRWKQVQADDGRRQLSIGKAVEKTESWDGMTERQICEVIVRDKPDFKRITGLLPKGKGLTQAIVAAAIEAGSMSNKDLVIYTPTLEDLGLLQVKEIRDRWEQAVKASEDTRAANIATRVRTKDAREKLQAGADTALKKAVEETMRGIRLYVFIDRSGSQNKSIEKSKEYLPKFLQSFPLDKMHVAAFNTVGTVIDIKHPSAAGVENAFRGMEAGGGTAHLQAIYAVRNLKPKPDEDAVMIFIGDEGESGDFTQAVRASGINPVAFGLLKMPGEDGQIVRRTAQLLGIPCFPIDEKIFADPYAVPRTMRALISATPVGRATERAQPRASLIDLIIGTELLKKPAWA